ncbi:zinc transport system substrate-binding protein [Catenulispora sp. GAS73]|uniref:metal ABC transporter substrate-binding protein n=1 Tax=Catenulispora sp. GAS73 TaxID=3156269 RepID=UPI003513E4E5
MPFRNTEPGRLRRPAVAAAALVTALVTAVVLSGCVKQADRSAGGSGRLDVVAGFYPFAYLAEQIGGEHVSVRNLTRPGAEPHDLELTPSQVGAVSKADLAIYEKGLQPAVDSAVAQNKPKAALDTATVVHLENHGDLGEGDAHSADPHVWLDPVDFAKIADAVSAELQRIDAAHAADYQANQAALDGRLTTLDADYRAGLARCVRKDIVTSHAAFGYLAERYGLVQVPIAGLSPDDEPSAAHLAKIQHLIKTEGVTTVFFETLASPKTARTLAADTGTKAAVLDPIEGVKDPSTQDYFSIMRDNLAALRTALGCS